MGNIREKYRVEIDSKNPKKDENNKKRNETSYDVASYPFGAEEMLLDLEFKKGARGEDR